MKSYLRRVAARSSTKSSVVVPEVDHLHDPFEQVAPLELAPGAPDQPAVRGVAEEAKPSRLDADPIAVDRPSSRREEATPPSTRATPVEPSVPSLPAKSSSEVVSAPSPQPKHSSDSSAHTTTTLVEAPRSRQSSAQAESIPRPSRQRESEAHAAPAIAAAAPVEARTVSERISPYGAQATEPLPARDTRPSREPNVVIGRISVEVVRTPPPIVEPASPPPRAAAPDTIAGLGMKHRFGIGQL
ncbi:hypothetical protein BH09MYX1_BH09MYX1_08520 [soil metagenome]